MNKEAIEERINKLYPEKRYTYLISAGTAIVFPFIIIAFVNEFDFTHIFDLEPKILITILILTLIQVVVSVRAFQRFKKKIQLLDLLDDNQMSFLQKIV